MQVLPFTIVRLLGNKKKKRITVFGFTVLQQKIYTRIKGKVFVVVPYYLFGFLTIVILECSEYVEYVHSSNHNL